MHRWARQPPRRYPAARMKPRAADWTNVGRTKAREPTRWPRDTISPMRVFVSSTFVDLVHHRRAVAEALERLGLGLRRMEFFGARPVDATEASLDEVENSELFVGIYAHRYGYVPHGASCSVTESEFDHAIRLRRPTFCYVVDPDFPWPHELIEEGAATQLAAFKQRVQSMVVRDTFTTPDVLATRISTAVGRYLIADPRKHGARTAADHARLSIADVATATFVDIMRLAVVAGSPRARSANEPRYDEFVDIADAHLADLRTQLTRLGADAAIELAAAGESVERGIAWALTRLRRAPHMNPAWIEFMPRLHEIAEKVDNLATSASAEYYRMRLAEVTSIIAEHLPSQIMSLDRDPDLFSHHRFALQTVVLNEMRARGRFAIATIRDDADRRLAIPYFLIDLTLLRKLVNEPPSRRPTLV